MLEGRWLITGAPRYRDPYRYWTKIFAVAFAMGVVSGAFIQGFAVEGGAFVGGSLDWLTPFCLLTGAALIPGYALLGATWLVFKTEGALQDWAYEAATR